MHLLYKTYASTEMDLKGQVLLPGYKIELDKAKLQTGDTLHVELADGTFLRTTLVQTQLLDIDKSLASKVHASPGLYYAVKVPKDFDIPGIELGANIYVETLE